VQHNDGLKEKTVRAKRMELIKGRIDRHQFQQSIINDELKIRFDYDINVFSLRGDWRNHIRAVILYFPIDIVISNINDKVKLKRFENLIQASYQDTYCSEEEETDRREHL